jgi:ammonia channel protein AmtB
MIRLVLSLFMVLMVPGEHWLWDFSIPKVDCFYGGGASQLLTQFIGVAAVFVWAFGCGFILFKILKAVNGLRVSKRIEEEGLDVYEHGEAVYNM